ncbi:MAG: hypothetical protein KDJ31_13990 [Candidatus Competibacteraceae bacterium]|nr:hypothetical protein [Candidatus Competibacteraceae bacterium]
MNDWQTIHIRSTPCAYPDQLTLQNTTVNAAVTHTACSSITAGSTYVVSAAGAATLRAGARITLQPGFRVQTGGRFRAWIDPCMRSEQ